MRIAILTGGGDAPGLNAAIRAVSRRAFQLGHQVSGIKNGWAGALSGDMANFTPADVRGILHQGGTILGTSRTNPMKEPNGVNRVLSMLKSCGVDSLVAIGGDDTLSVAKALHEADYPVVGVPKTIDNDLQATEFCIGFDTAVGIVVEALDRLHTTASAHHRVMVVEVMGRDTGWVAVMGGMAGGGDLILIPEFAVTIDEVVEHLEARLRAGSEFSIIVVAEGVEMEGLASKDAVGDRRDAFGHVMLSRRAVGESLAGTVEQRTQHESRTTVLGHVQRGGSPSAYDRIWATRVGAAAYDLIEAGAYGHMPVVVGGSVQRARIADVVATQRRVPRELYDLARVFY